MGSTFEKTSLQYTKGDFMKNKFSLFLILLIISAIFTYAQKQNEASNPNSPSDTYLFEVNDFRIPIDNRGIIADVVVGPIGGGGFFDNHLVLFSAGFFLSGYEDLNNDNDFTRSELWGNGVMSASRILDYNPGPVGSDSGDVKNQIYQVGILDTPFGNNWIDYKTAVELGADFYDGDGDGIYNPVDLNNNGKWDENEDRPLMNGVETAWTIFNDNVPIEDRRYLVTPKGIEVHQTVWGYNIPGSGSHFAENTIFIKYKIFNTGTVADTLHEVAFTSVMDADIGEYSDDLAGSDILRNAGYVYNSGDDSEFGPNAPALFCALLQGPAVSMPGETFIDVNNNSMFDYGIDTPLDSAKIFIDELLGSIYKPGYKNLGMTSMTQYMQSHPVIGDPDEVARLRQYMLGDVVDNIGLWSFGNGASLGDDTVNIPKQFMYSGYPENGAGWLNTYPIDQRTMVNSGLFDLVINEPQEIIVAYVVGRSSSPILSVANARANLDNVIELYNNDFNMDLVSVDDQPMQVEGFQLEQNYPNPFNPTTSIEYSVFSKEFITIKVYDVLGKEVAQLVNEEKEKGNYKVSFNASNLSSGVYIYQLSTGSQLISRKMMLIK